MKRLHGTNENIFASHQGEPKVDNELYEMRQRQTAFSLVVKARSLIQQAEQMNKDDNLGMDFRNYDYGLMFINEILDSVERRIYKEQVALGEYYSQKRYEGFCHTNDEF